MSASEAFVHVEIEDGFLLEGILGQGNYVTV